jgi:AcrR family transcriptional regulator
MRTPEVNACTADLEVVRRDAGAGAPSRLLVAALECFADRGYHATTTRDIAMRAEMSPAAVYVHYPSKEELLFRLARLGHAHVLQTMKEATDTQHGDSRPRLWRLVRAFTEWHAQHHLLARVANYELNALPADRLNEILRLRREVAQTVITEMRRGERGGELEIDDLRGSARAVLSLGVDIARWYRPSGPRTPEDLGRLYADLVLRMVHPRAAAPRGRTSAPVTA